MTTPSQALSVQAQRSVPYAPNLVYECVWCRAEADGEPVQSGPAPSLCWPHYRRLLEILELQRKQAERMRAALRDA